MVLYQISAFWGFEIEFDDLPLKSIIQKHLVQYPEYIGKTGNLEEPSDNWNFIHHYMNPHKVIAELFEIEEKCVLISHCDAEMETRHFIAITEIKHLDFNKHVVTLPKNTSVDETLLNKIQSMGLKINLLPHVIMSDVDYKLCNYLNL